MAIEVIMPKAGMAMEEGTIIKWLKKVGEKIEAEEPILEIETDKTSMEVEAPAAGFLIKILKNDGDVVPVTQVIGYIGKADEIVQQTAAPETNAIAEEKNAVAEKVVEAGNTQKLQVVGSRVAATPYAKMIAAEKGIDIRLVPGTGSFGEIKAEDVRRFNAVKATPLAAKIAQDRNIDLSRVQGSGFGGKIRKEDLETATEPQAKTFTPAKTTESAAAQPAEQPVRKQIKGIRKVIADRMLKSHLEIPPVTLNVKADVTELVALRAKINTSADVKISINDFILKAVAIALKEMPHINVNIEGNEIVYKSDVNVGMAVALEEGLIVPVIKNIDTLSLAQISRKSKELAGKAKEGKLLPDDYAGGTFTVSNLGMFDVLSFTPIINQPEASILGACAIENELKMIDGKIESRGFMGLSLTFDHRIIDGAQAAVYLKRIKLLLQEPFKLLV